MKTESCERARIADLRERGFSLRPGSGVVGVGLLEPRLKALETLSQSEAAARILVRLGQMLLGRL